MILRAFPDLNWLKRQAAQSFANQKDVNGKTLPTQGWPNVVLNARTSNTYRDNIKGPISIFTNISGKSTVETDGKKAVINEGFFFVTNRAQEYTLHVENTATETFNIHFGDHFAEGVLKSLQAKPSELLEFSIPSVSPIELYNKLYVRDIAIQNLLADIRNQQGALDEEEKLVELMIALLTTDGRLRRSQAEIPAVKNSTREEIQKRLHNATDFVYSFYDRDITLDDLAEAACLSKFHFLRLFKTIYRQTPHQFITSVKIDRAKSLLKNHSTDVNQIAKSLGFDSSSTFSRAFYNQVKVYPSQFRAQA